MKKIGDDPRPSIAETSSSAFRRPLCYVTTHWLERVDPGAHRRVKGLRLVTAYGIAAMLGALLDVVRTEPGGAALSPVAGGFALWASVSEGRGKRFESSRDLLLFAAAAALGATSFIIAAPILQHLGRAGPELTLATGAFLVGYLRRFGITGAGLGSQAYIGQLLAYGAQLGPHDLPVVGVAGLVAALAAIVPRMLSGSAEQPIHTPAPLPPGIRSAPPEVVMGLQAATAAIVIVALNAAVGLVESAWAITACTYVVASSPSATIDRVKRRIIGTMIGVPIALALLPLAATTPFVVWGAAALAMIVYAMALPERYDIACGAYAFALIITLAATGEHSIFVLASRAWETLLGGAIGLAATMVVPPVLTMFKICGPSERSR
jgi:hypothetical protein